MRFYRVEHHTIMSGLVVRYKLKESGLDGQISASREGVLIQGAWPHLSPDDARDFKTVMDRAANQAEQLAIRNPVYGWGSEPQCVVELRRAHFAGEDEVIETR